MAFLKLKIYYKLIFARTIVKILLYLLPYNIKTIKISLFELIL
jgi:hypothetical protein